MITGQPSSSRSIRLRAAVAASINVSTLFLLIAISTNHWANGFRRIEFAGLWKFCTSEVCISHADIIHAKVLLTCSFIVALLTCIGVIVAWWYDVSNIKMAIAKCTIFLVIVELGGMISATIYFCLLFESIAYGLVLGWVAAVLMCVAFGLSFYHAKIEPDQDSPTPEVKPEGDNIQPPPAYMADPPPSYMADPPPSSIIVS
ncbi:uncharacterized protein LOC142106790 [Mixophyes fleayi]|uniref:uncharacterized protein LOC142106790 n=1 Tax=Mixophyes fleayi TaxID=3061075 RepID=UPI003F4E180E